MIDVVSHYGEKAAGRQVAISVGNFVEENNFDSKCWLLAFQLINSQTCNSSRVASVFGMPHRYKDTFVLLTRLPALGD